MNTAGRAGYIVPPRSRLPPIRTVSRMDLLETTGYATSFLTNTQFDPSALLGVKQKMNTYPTLYPSIFPPLIFLPSLCILNEYAEQKLKSVAAHSTCRRQAKKTMATTRNGVPDIDHPNLEQ